MTHKQIITDIDAAKELQRAGLLLYHVIWGSIVVYHDAYALDWIEHDLACQRLFIFVED